MEKIFDILLLALSSRIGAVDPERVWAAGFFDGEGCVACYYYADRRDKNGKLRGTILMASVRQACDPDGGTPAVLLRFQAAVRLGTLSGPILYPAPRRPMYSWQCAGAEVGRLFDSLAQWLSPVKRAAFVSAIERYNARPLRRTAVWREKTSIALPG
jgi:hypothetical protein